MTYDITVPPVHTCSGYIWMDTKVIVSLEAGDLQLEPVPELLCLAHVIALFARAAFTAPRDEVLRNRSDIV